MLRLHARLRVDHDLRFDGNVEQREHGLQVAGLWLVVELRRALAQLLVQRIDRGVALARAVLDSRMVHGLIEGAGAPLRERRYGGCTQHGDDQEQ